MKTKLEVLKINEDVIATSGVVHCTHQNTAHYYTITAAYTDSGTNYYVDVNAYKANQHTPHATNATLNATNFNMSTSGIVSGQWYYYNSDTLKYELCDGDHENYTK